MVMYQNEVYSYIFYFGCVWIVIGMICFNKEYLVFILR